MLKQSCHLERSERSKRFELRFFAPLRMTIFLLFSVCSFMPAMGLAATVGFAPATGIWFSDSTVKPNQLVRVYTVVVNNAYFALDGVVEFDDNGEAIDTTAFKALEKESAVQLKILWQPTGGNHTVTARFTSATAIDNNGQRSVLPASALNQLNSTSFIVGGAAPSAATTSPTAAPTSLVGQAAQDSGVQGQSSTEKGAASASTLTVPTANVTVERHGDTLTIVPAVRGEAQPVVATSGLHSFVASVVGKIDDLFSKNHQAIEKAQSAVVTVSTTANSAMTAYSQTKSAIAKGQDYYNQGQGYFAKIQAGVGKLVSFALPLAPLWDTVSDNNSPKRIVIICVVVVVIFWLVGKSRRRDRNQRYFDR